MDSFACNLSGAVVTLDIPIVVVMGSKKSIYVAK